jgi:5-methylcytosine-specific restriction endonuclease McrA
MCRGKDCTEFGSFETWSREAPLPLPRWFWDEIAKFADAARLAARGERERARDVLRALREREVNRWYDEHGQNACYTRVRRVQHPPIPSVHGRRRPRTPDLVRRRVYDRDAYHCRYCGLPTIATEARQAFQDAVGPDVLFWGNENTTQHGIALAARTEYDHVIPIRVGGANDETNLVTACACCNYGKYKYTLEELGLDDPRNRPPVVAPWDGLTSLIPYLNAASRD